MRQRSETPTEATGLIRINGIDRPASYESFDALPSHIYNKELRTRLAIAAVVAAFYAGFYAFELCLYEQALRHPIFHQTPTTIESGGLETYRQMSVMFACMHGMATSAGTDLIAVRILRLCPILGYGILIFPVGLTLCRLLKPQMLMNATIAAGGLQLAIVLVALSMAAVDLRREPMVKSPV